MSDLKTDPLSIIAANPPRLDLARAAGIVREHYGLAVECRELVSERDQNFHLTTTDDGREFVLKIANSAEEPQVTHCQIEALLHLQDEIRAAALSVRVPELLMTRDGRSHLLVEADGASHVTRVISYLPGVPLSMVPLTARLSRNMGLALAWLGIGLQKFEHAGVEQSLLWDMKEALALRKLLPHVPDREMRHRIAACLDDFEQYALPLLASARTQVIHNDLHGDNVLVVADSPETISGVIDFGDMLRSPLIVDLGVAAAYLRCDAGEPLSLIEKFVSGYHSVMPLLPSEFEVLYFLVRARLAATIAIHYWRASARSIDDPYLQVSEESAAQADAFLQILDKLSAQQVSESLHAACETNLS